MTRETQNVCFKKPHLLKMDKGFKKNIRMIFSLFTGLHKWKNSYNFRSLYIAHLEKQNAYLFLLSLFLFFVFFNKLKKQHWIINKWPCWLHGQRHVGKFALQNHYCECCRCLNSSQSAPTSDRAKKSLGAILANINLKPTEVEFASLFSLREASFVKDPIK